MLKLLLCALLLTSVAMAAGGVGVAQVTGVKGTMVLTRGGQPVPCGMFASLQAGDRLQVPADGQVTLFFYSDNHREVIPGAVTFTLSVKGTDVPEGKKTVSQTPSALKVTGGSLMGLNSDQFGGSVKRGDSAPIKLLNGPNVLDANPTLRWDVVHGATDYSVEVSKDFGDPPFISATVSTPSYRLAQPLERGHVSVVKIVAHGQDGHAINQGTTMLQVLSADKADPLLAARQAADSAITSGDLSPYVALAACYLHEGLTAETVEVLQVLADKAPGSPYPHERMAALYKNAGLPIAAEQEQAKASSL